MDFLKFDNCPGCPNGADPVMLYKEMRDTGEAVRQGVAAAKVRPTSRGLSQRHCRKVRPARGEARLASRTRKREAGEESPSRKATPRKATLRE